MAGAGFRRLTGLLAILLVAWCQGHAAASAVQLQPEGVSVASTSQSLADLGSQQHNKQQQQPPKHNKQQTQHTGIAAAAAAAAAGSDSLAVLPGDPDPAGDALIDWIRQNGGEVNVAIRKNVPGSGRGTFAPRALKKGDVLARIPVEMTYTLSPDDESLAVSGSFLMADMAEEDSPWKPYFDSLPGPSDVWSSAHVPQSYLPIIQDQWTETAISHMQANVQDLWEAHSSKYKQVLGPNVSAANITYSMGVLLTRLFRFDGVDVLLPIVDMANHANECMHSHVPEPCDPEEGYKQWQQGPPRPKLAESAGSGVYGALAAAAAAEAAAAADAADSASSSSNGTTTSGLSSSVVSGQCLVWRAEEEVQPGQEVCNSYKVLMQDRALLQYGFLQAGAPALELSVLDRHDHIHDLEHVWDDPPGSNGYYGPRRFEGTPAQIEAEIVRLTARLQVLQQGDAAAAAIRPDSALDPDGSRLAAMLEWRQQRKDSMQREVSRLQRQAQRLAKAQSAWGDAGLEAANKGLLQWLEANGATANVELKAVQPDTSSSQQQVCSNTDDASQSCAAGNQQQASPAAGVFTRQAVKAGELLAVLPLELSYSIKAGSEKLDSAVRLMRDINQVLQEQQQQEQEEQAPVLRSLPPLGSVRSLYNFPQEYMPFLMQRRTEAHIKRLQRALSEEFESYRAEIEAVDNSTAFAELQHAASLIATRPLLPVDLSGTAPEELLVPLFSSARHNSSCAEHDHFIDPCPGSSSSGSSGSLCLFWVAGADLLQGAEVCVSFGNLRADQALLMYGLPAKQPIGAAEDTSSSSSDGDAKSPEMWLSGLDTMDADGANPLGRIADEPLERWLPESREQAVAESVWLVEMHANLTDPKAAANISSIPSAAWDADGAFLGQLRQWRQQRVAAIEWELGRLSEAWNISGSELAVARDRVKLSEAGGSAAAQLEPGSSGIIANFTSSSSDPFDRLLEWMRHNGAVINVNVTYAGPQYGRVVVASEPTVRGDILAAIPLDLVWSSVKSGGNGSMQLAAANLFAELDNPDSLWRPYLDALPTQEEVLCPMVATPEDYFPVLQDHKAVGFVKHYQGYISEFWEQFGQDMQSKVPSMTLERFKYARALLSTRLFGMAEGTALVPLLDLANHAPYCSNLHVEQPCPQDPDRECIVWTAGAFVPRGGELCNGYKWMANDRSALQYGFLQTGPIRDGLHTVDHPATNDTNVFAMFDNEAYGPPPFDGTAEQIEAELSRLQTVLANVTAGDAAAAAVKPVAADKAGRLLGLLQGVRQQRKEALNKEISRLQQRLAAVKAAADGASPSSSTDASSDELLQWLRDNGGQVNGVRLGSAASAGAKQQPSTRRGVFATQAIKQGSVMAAVPLDLALPINTNNLLIDGPMLHTELRQAQSTRAPYYKTLPGPAEVLSYYQLPVAYGPVIQHGPTEAFLHNSNTTLQEFLEDNPQQLAWRNMTVSDLKHVFSLVATRMVHLEEGGHLVPLIDMAQHRNGCPHSIVAKDCSSSARNADGSLIRSSSKKASSKHTQGGLNTTRLCLFLKAGSDLAAGQEVCLAYGHLLPDRSMLQYGFIPDELLGAVTQQQQQSQPQQQQQGDAAGVPLFGLDRHDFREHSDGTQLPWRFWMDQHTGPPDFSGTPQEVAAEVKRLELLAEELAAGDAAAAAVQPVAFADPDGSVLQRLRLWRRLRKVAVAREIQRLKQLQQQQQQPEQQQEL